MVEGGSECVPDVPLSGNTSQFFLGIPRSPQARWDTQSNPSSVFWIHCWVSSHLDVPGRLPKGGVQSGPTPTLQLMPSPDCLFILCPNFLHHLWRRPQAVWFISDWTNFKPEALQKNGKRHSSVQRRTFVSLFWQRVISQRLAYNRQPKLEPIVARVTSVLIQKAFLCIVNTAGDPLWRGRELSGSDQLNQRFANDIGEGSNVRDILLFGLNLETTNLPLCGPK